MRAYVIGNIAVDEIFSVPSMPEIGASILGRQATRDLGGKGANQAIVMGRCGLPTTLVAAVGDDARAADIRGRIAEEPVDARIVTLPGRSSDVSLIFTAPDGENAIVTTTEAADALSLADALAALASAEQGDLAVLQGNLGEEVTGGVLTEARRRGLVTAVNPSPLRAHFDALWPLVDVAFLNRGEAQALAGASDRRAASRLIKAGAGHVVLTLGGEGAWSIGAGGTVHVPAVATPVVDTTGAGDTFMAVALASAALRGRTIDARAIGHAAAAAALTVGRRGTRSAFPNTVELARILAA